MSDTAHRAHRGGDASPWVMRWAASLPAGARVLDLACGSGRNARWLAAQGFVVRAVDRDAEALAGLAGVPGISTRQADLEGAPWPLVGETFDAVVVCRYLHRPLFPQILATVTPGGLLIYETFMLGNEQYGRPSRPEFLLAPGELAALANKAGWAIEGLREGVESIDAADASHKAVTQSICARKPVTA
ncbi:MAG TPA: methyltransferase domain-containing protein [Rhodocyclaceae bacterium]